MAIKAIVFDVGGVLAHDVWESLVIGKQNSILTICNLDTGKTKEVGQILWGEFAHKNTDEKNGWQELEMSYWNKFVNELNLQLTETDLIKLTDDFIRPIPGMMKLVERLHMKGTKLAICSNNTEFWYERQNNKLGFEKYFPKENVILSSRIGVSKESPNFEMFEAAISSLEVDKSSCLFIDDRKENIDISVVLK